MRADEQRSRMVKASAKGPTSQQWAAMAGAMHNALERLRTFSQTLGALLPVSGFEEDIGGIVMLHGSERLALIGEVEAAANILRVGLKARFRK